MRSRSVRWSLAILSAVVMLTVGSFVVAWRMRPSPSTSSVSDDFNDTRMGGVPAGWSTDTSGGTVGVVDMPDAVDASLRIAKKQRSGRTSATKRINTMAGEVQVEVRVRTERGLEQATALDVLGGEGVSLATVLIREGQFRDADSGRSLLAAAANRWYVLRAMIHTDSHYFDLFIDGQRVLKNASFRNKLSDVSRLSFGIGSGGSGVLYVDSLSVRGTPRPSVTYSVLDQFNSAAVGYRPPGYEVTAGARVVAVPSQEDRSVLLSKSTVSGEVSAARSFPPLAGRVIVQATVRTDEVVATKVALCVRSSADATVASIQIDKKVLVVDDGGAVRTLASVEAGEWYTIRLAIDAAAGQFDVFVDGRRVSADGGLPGRRWAFRDGSAKDVGRVFLAVGAGQAGTLYADNLMVYRNPTPAPPEPTLDVRRFGATGDGVADDTAAIQAAIDAVGDGGSVYLGGGTFLAGTIRLKARMTLFIDHDAVLLGSQDDVAYPVLSPKSAGTPRVGGLIEKALVYSVDADDVKIDGGGTIDGGGRIKKWMLGDSGSEKLRPVALFLTRGKNISVRNIHVKDAAMWAIVPAEVDGLLLADLNIDSNIFAMRDGIDVVDSRNVLIERTNVWSDDDAICFKSYAAVDGGPVRVRGVEDVVLRLSTVNRSERANGVKFGTASYDSFRNVLVQDVRIKHVDDAAIAVTSVYGGLVSNLAFRRVSVDRAERAFFVLSGKHKDSNVRARPVSSLRFEDIAGTHIRSASVVTGTAVGDTTFRIYDVLVSNVDLMVSGGLSSLPPDPPEYDGRYPDGALWTGQQQVPACGYFIRHATGVTIQDSAVAIVAPDIRRDTELRDVTDAVVGDR